MHADFTHYVNATVLNRAIHLDRRLRNSEALAHVDRRLPPVRLRDTSGDRRRRRSCSRERRSPSPADANGWTAHHRGGRILWQQNLPPGTTPEPPTPYWRCPGAASPYSTLPSSAKHWDICINPLKVSEVTLVGHARSRFRPLEDGYPTVYTTFSIFPGNVGSTVAITGEVFEPVFLTSGPDLTDEEPSMGAVFAAARTCRALAQKAAAQASYLAWLTQDPMDAFAALAAMDLEEALTLASKTRLLPEQPKPNRFRPFHEEFPDPIKVTPRRFKESLKHLALADSMHDISQAFRLADKASEHLRSLHLGRYSELNPCSNTLPKRAPDVVNDLARALEASMFPSGRLYDAAVMAATQHFEMCVAEVNWAFHKTNIDRADANLNPLSVAEDSVDAASYTQVQEQQLASFHRRSQLHDILDCARLDFNESAYLASALSSSSAGTDGPRAASTDPSTKEQQLAGPTGYTAAAPDQHPPGADRVAPVLVPQPWADPLSTSALAAAEAAHRARPRTLANRGVDPPVSADVFRHTDTAGRWMAHPDDAHPGRNVPTGQCNKNTTAPVGTVAPLAPGTAGTTNTTGVAPMAPAPTAAPPSATPGLQCRRHQHPAHAIPAGAAQPTDVPPAAGSVQPGQHPPTGDVEPHRDQPDHGAGAPAATQRGPHPGGGSTGTRLTSNNLDYIRQVLQCPDHAGFRATFRLRTGDGTTLQLTSGLPVTATRAAALLEIIHRAVDGELHLDGDGRGGEHDEQAEELPRGGAGSGPCAAEHPGTEGTATTTSSVQPRPAARPIEPATGTAALRSATPPRAGPCRSTTR
jgi:hypothetical protein